MSGGRRMGKSRREAAIWAAAYGAMFAVQHREVMLTLGADRALDAAATHAEEAEAVADAAVEAYREQHKERTP